ncbi:DUF2085 domain-containing protein [Methanobacterium sp. VT]|uniref:DUF2085 domain-containing protein n=2 Tax=Methanobacterium spitsbergense TaxID=2874285 RepID=A0A8T5URI6_9EURY|nr:DUF2085 domain-containing protein [Methanobacterium spitsbergense]MBZ2166642.1 DUF2085 domain-containing protein [Methanobacterium spitsbergense]
MWSLNRISLKIHFLTFFTQFICHRIPERSFNIQGYYFPVCSRCTGLYLGAFSYFTYVYFNFVEYTSLLIILGFLMIIPTFIDGTTQLSGFRESNNKVRFISGLIGGIGFAILIKAIKYFILSKGGF